MTAFVREEEVIFEQGHLVWEIRTVNHRYMDVSFRLPDGFSEYEPLLREKIKSVISRGKVDCSLFFSGNQNKVTLGVDEHRLAQLKRALTLIAEHFPECEKGQCVDILSWPGVLTEYKTEINNTAMKELLSGSFDNALSKIIIIRQNEGKKLGEAVYKRMRAIENYLQSLEKHVPDITKKQHEKLMERCQRLVNDIEVSRLEQEVAFLAQKSDISEEVDRLFMHVSEVVNVLERDAGKGRRLDFLMQELNREANTIAAKSTDMFVSKIAIDMKVMIEQAREQIQNIE